MTKCKSKLLVFILVSYFHFCHQSDATTIITESSTNWLNVKDTFGKVIFQVLGSTVIVPNGHRANSSLKFSLGSSSIVQVELKNRPVLSEDIFWTFHLQDKSSVDFLVYNENETTRYDLLWHGGGPNGPEREVCFHPDFNNATWFDTYQPRESARWPMKIWSNQQQIPFNFLLNQFPEQVAELIFYNSDGFAVVLDENQPLFVRRQAGADPSLCFSVNNTAPYSSDTTDPSYLDIKIHLYASSNIPSVSEYVISRSKHIPKPVSTPPEDAFSRTTWMIRAEYVWKETDYSGYLDHLVSNGFTHGEILDEVGPNAKLDSVISNYVKHDFQVKHAIEPSIGPSGPDVPKICLIGIIGCEVPDWSYYIRVKNPRLFGSNGFRLYSVDFSNPSAVEWFASQRNQMLRSLRGRVHSVHVDKFDTYLGTNFKLHNVEYEKYPNRLIGKFVETVAQLKELNSSAYVSTRVAYKSQHLPVVVQLWMFGQYPNTAGYLQSLITHALSVSMSGYSYFATNPIGSPDAGLTEELYIRWVQASTFMPHMTFYRSPWIHGQATVNITRRFVNLHTKYVPLMMRLARERVRTGSPLVRPMWYIEPDNREVYGIVDQFMLGKDLVVAPVLKAGQRERTVHLPPGNWLDQRGILFEGAKQVKVPVPLEELAYFTRV